jgi:flagellar motor switch protein FliM
LRPIAKQLNTKLWYTNEVTGAGKHILVNLKQKLINTKVDVSVAFKDTTAKIEDILSFRSAMFCSLFIRLTKSFLVKVCDKNVFLGELGVIKNKYVCKKTETIKEASQYYE